MGFTRFFALSILLLFSLVSRASTEELVKYIKQKKWEQAYKATNDKDYKSLVLWLQLSSDTNINFNTLVNFINNHPNWPKIEVLKVKLEQSDFANSKESQILDWFQNNPPQTLLGKKKYIELLHDKKHKEHYIKIIWERSIFSKKEEQNFLKKYGNLLNLDDYIHRINYLLFNNYSEQAARLLDFIPLEKRAIYQLQINLQEGKKDALLGYKKLDSKQRNDIGILHNLAHLYESQKDEKNLITILNQATKIGGKYQFYFWNMKAKLIRNLIQEKEYKTAYLFASSHGQLSAKEYSEAEWLSGWIALRFLNQPKTALQHFNNMHSKVKLPISIARASYWIARSYEALKDKPQAEHWYKIAAKYYISFYGQLAVCKINDCKINIPEDHVIDNKSKQLFNNNPLVKVALLLDKTQYADLVQEFLSKAIENSSDYGEITLITQVGFQIEKSHISVEAAKQASYKDVHVIASSYPVLKAIYKDHQVDISLIMALIRQESVFNHRAISSAGAMGLMQLMPHVAKETAKKSKDPFHKTKLIADPHFNTKMGIKHLEKLLTNYNGSYILTIAAYNAGEKSVTNWISNNGDPRNIKELYDIIDWMEQITFHETRNYVQRVLEGKSIYNILINKDTKLSIINDLGL